MARKPRERAPREPRTRSTGAAARASARPAQAPVPSRSAPRGGKGASQAPRDGAAVVLGLVFFTSGAAGLVHELVWTRLLGHVFGVSSFAIATVLAAYMGGLALGSWWISGRTARIRDARRAYALLEVGIAASALAVPGLLALVEPVYGAIWRSFHLSFGVFSVLRLLLASAILLAPTAMMGATFPVLATEAARRPNTRLPAHWLYTLNLAGAVAGVAIGGFFLLPGLGVWGTIVVGAALNLAAAVGALRLSPATIAAEAVPAEGMGASVEGDREGSLDPAAWEPHESALELSPEISLEPSLEPPVPPVLLQGAAFVSGAIALVAQVGWSRVLSRVVGSTTYAFTSVLLATLIALGVGSTVAARLGRRREIAAQAIAPAFLLAGLLALIAIGVVHRLPAWYLDLYSVWGAEVSGGLIARGLATAFLATFPSVACAGMVLPLVLAVAVPRDARATGGAVGTIYALNTVGAIFGSLLAGFVLVPGIGTQRTIAGAALVGIGTGLAIAYGWPRPPWLRPAAIAAASGAAIAALFTPPWDPQLLHFGVAEAGFHAHGTEALRERFTSQSERGDVLYEREGRTASVIVLQIGAIRGMKIDARANASDHPSDMMTQSMLALYPLSVAPRSDDVFVVGWGTGVTVGAALQAPVREVTAVELEPAVVEASRLFDHVNHRPLEDQRVRLHEDDARHILLASESTYDVIISEPPHPWVAGVANLFTRDFYELAARRLAPDGVFAQWVQSYQISFETYRSILATFQSVFPETVVFTVPNGSDTILVGSREPLRLDPAALAKRWADPSFAAELGRFGLTRPEALLAAVVIGPSRVRDLARGAPINTDDNMRIEFDAAIGTTHQIDMGIEEIHRRASPLTDLVADAKGILGDPDRLAAYVAGLELMKRDTSGYAAPPP